MRKEGGKKSKKYGSTHVLAGSHRPTRDVLPPRARHRASLEVWWMHDGAMELLRSPESRDWKAKKA